ncbi:MAG: TolC family protein [Bacteroidetes bacterium]|nr:TolC family protein [Bacteroidota bacterium]MBS1930028.1 TolC family protein [Bacteroidota bacterium]
MRDFFGGPGKNIVSKRITVVFALIMAISNPVFPQSVSDSLLKEPTLQNIIQYALRKQPVVQQALMAEAITDLQIKSKLADWYPQVNFNYLYQHNFQVQTSIIGGNPVRLGVNNTSAIQFSASQTIFNRDVLLAKQTKDFVLRQTRQQTSDTKIDLVANVSKAFYNVLTTKQQIKVTEENILRLQQSLKDARAQFDAGIVDKTDYKRATIALNNAEAEKRGNEEALLAKTEYLKSLINYPLDAELNIEYDSARMENEITVDTIQPADYTKRIEYQILETQMRLQEANVQYNKWSFIPSISANGAYSMNFLNNSFSKLYSQSFPNSYVGLTLSFPIFEGSKRKYNIQQSLWELKRTGLDIVNFKNQVNSEYSAALANYKASLSEFLALKENVGLAREVYDVIRLQYRSGIKTYLEVIAAETDLRTAQVNYFNALYQVVSNKIDVEKSKGEISY